MPFKFIKVPIDFECSITHEIMINPVFTADGETYECSAITDWLKTNDSSPNTNENLEHKNLTSNRKLKSQISNFVQENQKIFEQELIEAVKQGELNSVDLILKLNIRVNAQDSNGWTALHHAANENHLAIANLLLDHNCNLDQDTAHFVFSSDRHLSDINQFIEKLFKERAILNEQLFRNDLKKDIRLYDKANEEIKLFRIKEAIKTKLTSLEKGREVKSARYAAAPKTTPTLYREDEIRNSFRELMESEYYIKIIYLEYANVCNSDVMDSYDVPQYRCDKEKKVQYLEEQLRYHSPKAMEEIERLYRDYLKEESSKELVSENRNKCDGRILFVMSIPLESRQRAIMGKFYSLSIKAHAEVSDFDTVRKIIFAECEDIKEIEILKIKKQLHVIEEQILQAHSNLPYYVPFKVSLCTPLLLAAHRGNTDIVRLLLDRHANLLQVDNHQGTLFHWAVRSGQLSLVSLLLARKVDVHKRDELGSTILDTARAFGHLDCVKLIEDHTQEQQTLLTLEKFLQPLRHEIQNQRLQIQQLTLQSASPLSASNEDVSGLSNYRRISFIGNIGQLSQPEPSMPPLEEADSVSDSLKN